MTLKSVRNLNLHKDIPLLVTEDSREMLPMVFDKLNQMGQIIRPIPNYSKSWSPKCMAVISSMTKCYKNNRLFPSSTLLNGFAPSLAFTEKL